MAKTLSDSKFKAAAKDVFEGNPGVDVLFATRDGNFWLKSHKGLAQDHARRHDLEVEEVRREAIMAKAEKSDKPKS